MTAEEWIDKYEKAKACIEQPEDWCSRMTCELCEYNTTEHAYEMVESAYEILKESIIKKNVMNDVVDIMEKKLDEYLDEYGAKKEDV